MLLILWIVGRSAVRPQAAPYTFPLGYVGVDRPSITPENIRRIGGRHSRVWWTAFARPDSAASTRNAGSCFHSVLPCALATASQKRAEARIARPASRARPPRTCLTISTVSPAGAAPLVAGVW